MYISGKFLLKDQISIDGFQLLLPHRNCPSVSPSHKRLTTDTSCPLFLPPIKIVTIIKSYLTYYSDTEAFPIFLLGGFTKRVGTGNQPLTKTVKYADEEWTVERRTD